MSDEKPKAIDWRNVKQDTRPQKGWWAPGEYIRVCFKCNQGFIGDKRAGHCADCEYQTNEAITPAREGER